MKSVLLGLALLTLAPIAQAQVIIQTPHPPVGRVEAPAYREDYWRGQQEHGWGPKNEFLSEEHRGNAWQHAHCVRDYRGQEFCRR